ncbi:hypothetical protein B0H13DRAFT_2301354 [Mycena leptocephala]|nr:hypothetical protein B0H13DRAFT_2301354 [Mycena leptocephala]
MESDFLRFEFEVIASAILNKTVSSDFLLLALSLIQELGSSSFLTEAVLYFGQADLEEDDDFLSHLLVEKLGTGPYHWLSTKWTISQVAQGRPRSTPRYFWTRTSLVYVAPSSHDTRYLCFRVFQLAIATEPAQLVTRQAVDELLALSPLCIVATRCLSPGTVITALKGSLANLTDEEYTRLKRTDLRDSDIRRDFSIIHSEQMNKNYLLLGPARFANVSMTAPTIASYFVKANISASDLSDLSRLVRRITVHYGDGYFGRENRHCLCGTGEKLGRDGYAFNHTNGDVTMDSDSDCESNSELSDVLDEKRTRRRVDTSTSALSALSPAGPKQLPLSEELSEGPRTPEKCGTVSTDLGSHNPISRVASVNADNSVLFQNSRGANPSGLFPLNGP